MREALEKRGASFFHELVKRDCAAAGVRRARPRRACRRGHRHRRQLRGPARAARPPEKRRGAGRDRRPLVAAALRARRRRRSDRAHAAQALRRRVPVLLQRESQLPPWRELVRVYRRLEARGEIRGGRFVAGFGGEQFAASDAVGRLRAVRKLEKIDELVVLSARRSAQPGRHPHARGARGGDPPQPHPASRTACRSRRWRAGRCAAWPIRSLEEPRLRTLLARRSLRHPPQLHLRTPRRAKRAGLPARASASRSSRFRSLS